MEVPSGAATLSIQVTQVGVEEATAALQGLGGAASQAESDVVASSSSISAAIRRQVTEVQAAAQAQQFVAASSAEGQARLAALAQSYRDAANAAQESAAATEDMAAAQAEAIAMDAQRAAGQQSTIYATHAMIAAQTEALAMDQAMRAGLTLQEGVLSRVTRSVVMFGGAMVGLPPVMSTVVMAAGTLMKAVWPLLALTAVFIAAKKGWDAMRQGSSMAKEALEQIPGAIEENYEHITKLNASLRGFGKDLDAGYATAELKKLGDEAERIKDKLQGVHSVGLNLRELLTRIWSGDKGSPEFFNAIGKLNDEFKAGGRSAEWYRAQLDAIVNRRPDWNTLVQPYMEQANAMAAAAKQAVNLRAQIDAVAAAEARLRAVFGRSVGISLEQDIAATKELIGAYRISKTAGDQVRELQRTVIAATKNWDDFKVSAEAAGRTIGGVSAAKFSLSGAALGGDPIAQRMQRNILDAVRYTTSLNKTIDDATAAMSRGGGSADTYANAIRDLGREEAAFRLGLQQEAAAIGKTGLSLELLANKYEAVRREIEATTKAQDAAEKAASRPASRRATAAAMTPPKPVVLPITVVAAPVKPVVIPPPIMVMPKPQTVPSPVMLPPEPVHLPPPVVTAPEPVTIPAPDVILPKPVVLPPPVVEVQAGAQTAAELDRIEKNRIALDKYREAWRLEELAAQRASDVTIQGLRAEQAQIGLDEDSVARLKIAQDALAKANAINAKANEEAARVQRDLADARLRDASSQAALVLEAEHIEAARTNALKRNEEERRAALAVAITQEKQRATERANAQALTILGLEREAGAIGLTGLALDMYNVKTKELLANKAAEQALAQNPAALAEAKAYNAATRAVEEHNAQLKAAHDLQEMVKKSTRDLRLETEALADSMNKTLLKGITELSQTGMQSFGDFIAVIEDTGVKMVKVLGESIANQRKILDTAKAERERIGPVGPESDSSLVEAAREADIFVDALEKSIDGLVKFSNTVSAVAGAIATIQGTFKMGQQSSSIFGAGLSGIMSGAMSGQQIGGLFGAPVLGAAIGGVVGLTSSLLGFASGAKKAREEIVAFHKAFDATMQAYRDSVMGTSTAVTQALAQNAAQAASMRQQIEESLGGKRKEAEREKMLTEVTRLEAQGRIKIAQDFWKSIDQQLAALRGASGQYENALAALEQTYKDNQTSAQRLGATTEQMAKITDLYNESLKRLQAQHAEDMKQVQLGLDAREAAAKGAQHLADALARDAEESKEQFDALEKGYTDAQMAQLKYIQGLEDEKKAREELEAVQSALRLATARNEDERYAAQQADMALEHEKILADLKASNASEDLLAAQAALNAAEEATLAWQRMSARMNTMFSDLQQQWDIFGTSAKDQLGMASELFGFMADRNGVPGQMTKDEVLAQYTRYVTPEVLSQAVQAAMIGRGMETEGGRLDAAVEQIMRGTVDQTDENMRKLVEQVRAQFGGAWTTGELTDEQRETNKRIQQWLDLYGDATAVTVAAIDNYNKTSYGTVTGISASQATGILGRIDTTNVHLSSIEDMMRRALFTGEGAARFGGVNFNPAGSGEVTIYQLTLQITGEEFEAIASASPSVQALLDRVTGRGLLRTRASAGVTRT